MQSRSSRKFALVGVSGRVEQSSDTETGTDTDEEETFDNATAPFLARTDGFFGGFLLIFGKEGNSGYVKTVPCVSIVHFGRLSVNFFHLEKQNLSSNEKYEMKSSLILDLREGQESFFRAIIKLVHFCSLTPLIHLIKSKSGEHSGMTMAPLLFL
jgi:hypothetical protein